MRTRSKTSIVLDAWAMLALIFQEEPAGARVKSLFDQAESGLVLLHMSWINMGEVYYLIARRKNKKTADSILSDIQLLPMKLHVPTRSDILAAASLKAAYALSYADAFAVAVTQKLPGEICTGDPEIISLDHRFKIRRLYRSC